jgi:hypothetical protein
MQQRTVEPHLSVLNGMVSHPDMQKIRIIEFFFDSRPHWQFEAKKKIFLQTDTLDYIFIYIHTNKTSHHLKRAQTPSRWNGSIRGHGESCANQKSWIGGGWNSDDDRQISPLTRNLGIPCLIWEPIQLILFTVCTCV